MFERYTEKARRTIFFARYEASQVGSPEVNTEHLLLALLREKPGLLGSTVNQTTLINAVRSKMAKLVRISTSVDMPLSQQCERVLHHAAEESEHLKQIDTQHLLLGLLREDQSPAAQLLREYGIELEATRERFSRIEPPPVAAQSNDQPADRTALHALVDSLPERFLPLAQIMLTQIQTSNTSAGILEKLRAAQRERPKGIGTVGSGMTHRIEDGAHVRESHWAILEHKITLVERVKIAEDQKKLTYAQHLRGPKTTHQFELDIDLT